VEKLSEAFNVTKLHTRLFGDFYKKVDTLTPSLCFTECNGNAECGAAAFTVDAKIEFNCYLYYKGEFTDSADSTKNWISFTKPVARPAFVRTFSTNYTKQRNHGC
jgi:hypothetical protein